MTGNAFLDLLLIAIPALLLRQWWTGARVRELAVQHARQACQLRELQFLDQSVGLFRIRLRRGSGGAFCFFREYRFEFTDYGQFRDHATVTMQGQQLKTVHFPYTRDADGHRIYVH